MKSTNNVQTTEAMNKSALAPTWQACIVEDLSNEAQAAVVGGVRGGNRYGQLETSEQDWIYTVDWTVALG